MSVSAHGSPNEVVAIAYTGTAGTAAVIPKGETLLITASSAAWVQFGLTGVAPVAKTAPAILVGPWPTIIRRPSRHPSGITKVPTHVNAIQDSAGGTLSVTGLG